MDNAQLLLKEEEIIKLILEFLSSRHYHVTMRTLEKESNVFNCDYSDEVFFLRELVLDGDFDEVLDFGKSFSSSREFNQKQFNYTILRQKFIELIYMRYHILDKQSNKEQGVNSVMKTLRELEECCPSKEEYSNLCWLLTVPDLNTHEEFKNWRVDISRLNCFEDLLDCLSSLMPLVKKRKGNTKTAAKDRLLQLIVKGLFYESCIDYCQTVATCNNEKAILSLKNDILSSSLDHFPSNLLSWIHCLPEQCFRTPFEHMDVEVNITNRVNKQVVNLNPKSNNTFGIMQEEFRANQNHGEIHHQVKGIMEETLTSIGKTYNILSNRNGKVEVNHRNKSAKPERLDNNIEGQKVVRKSDTVIIESYEDKQSALLDAETKMEIDDNFKNNPKIDPNSDFHGLPLSEASNFEDLTEGIKLSEESRQKSGRDNVVRKNELNHVLTKKCYEKDVIEDKKISKQGSGDIAITYATEKIKPSPKPPAVPAPIRLDIDLNSAEEANGMITPVLDKKKNEFFKVNTSTPKPVKKGTPKPVALSESPVVKKIAPFMLSEEEIESKAQSIKEIRQSQEEGRFNEVKPNEDKENAFQKESVVYGPVINGVRRPISSGYLNTSSTFENRPEIAEFKSKKPTTHSPLKHELKEESAKPECKELPKKEEDAPASNNIDYRKEARIAPSNSGHEVYWKYTPQMMIEDGQAVRSVSFHPDGFLYAIGANSKMLRICKMDNKIVNDGRAIPSMPVMFRRNKYHRGSIYCMAWSPDGQILASGSNDKSIKLLRFDARCYEQKGDDIEINIHNGTVRELAFVPNRCGLLISGGAGDGKVHVTDVLTQKISGSFDGHSGNVLTVYAGHGDIIGTAGTDNTCRLWDLRSQRCIDVVVVGNSSPASVALSPTDKYLASGQEDGSILLYDLVAGRTLQNFRLHQSDCRSVRFSPDSTRLLSGSYDSTISLLHLNNDIEVCIPNHYVIGKHDDKVIQARWHPSEEYFLTSSADRTAVLWKADM